MILAAAPAMASAQQFESGRLVGEPTVAGDHCGVSVAADGGTVVVGAHQKNVAWQGADTGALYVFEQASGDWGQVAYLAASDGTDFDFLGWCVAMSSDVIAAGTPWDRLRRGGVCIFRRTSGQWAMTARLRPDEMHINGVYGYDVAMSGSRLVVGAPYFDEVIDGDVVNTHGVAYIYRDTGSDWELEARLAPGDASVSHFGESVAIDGDLAVVGSPRDNTDGISAGSAWVFNRGKTGEWSLVQRITPTEPEELGYFGGSVAIDGGTIVVSAEYSDAHAENAGAVYVFENAGDGWEQSQQLLPGTDLRWTHFGGDLAVSGDRIVVGAYEDQWSPGSAWVFTRSKGSPFALDAHLLASDGQAGDRFGDAVAMDGSQVIIGAPFWSLGQGSAYVYEPGGESPRADGDARTDHGNDFFSYFGTHAGHDYYVSDSGLEYYDARETARIVSELVGQPAYLVTINDESEHAWIQGTSMDRMWIGLNDLAFEGEFAWESGQPVSFLNWGGNEPQEATGSEDAVGMNGYGELHAWFDWGELLFPSQQPRLAPGLIEVEGLACVGDVNFDHRVGVNDLLAVINSWGSSSSGHMDVNHDGQIGVADLLEIISNWGQCE